MSWMRFLAAGQSFIGMKRKNSPYREAGQSWLRSVGAICQPGSEGAAPSPESGGARSLAGSPEAEPLLSPASAPHAARQMGEELFTSPEVPAQAGSRATAGALGTALGSARPARRTRLDKARGAGSMFKARRPLVQGELSLDSVQVMRNDLHDSDLELIPAAPAEARAGSAGRLLGRLTGSVPRVATAKA